MHDAKGRELKVGDIVLIPARSEDYCNVSVESCYGRRPDDSHERIGAINTGVLLRANPGDENSQADFAFRHT